MYSQSNGFFGIFRNKSHLSIGIFHHIKCTCLYHFCMPNTIFVYMLSNSHLNSNLCISHIFNTSQQFLRDTFTNKHPYPIQTLIHTGDTLLNSQSNLNNSTHYIEYNSHIALSLRFRMQYKPCFIKMILLNNLCTSLYLNHSSNIFFKYIIGSLND